MGLIRVIRWCFSLFELPTTLWGCYLGNICFKAGETSEATKCSWVSQLPSVLNQWCCTIFFRISAPYTVLLQQGMEQHAPCVLLKTGRGKRVLSSELKSTIISQSCRWLSAGLRDWRPVGAQEPACTEGPGGWGHKTIPVCPLHTSITSFTYIWCPSLGNVNYSTIPIQPTPCDTEYERAFMPKVSSLAGEELVKCNAVLCADWYGV